MKPHFHGHKNDSTHCMLLRYCTINRIMIVKSYKSLSFISLNFKFRNCAKFEKIFSLLVFIWSCTNKKIQNEPRLGVPGITLVIRDPRTKPDWSETERFGPVTRTEPEPETNKSVRGSLLVMKRFNENYPKFVFL